MDSDPVPLLVTAVFAWLALRVLKAVVPYDLPVSPAKVVRLIMKIVSWTRETWFSQTHSQLVVHREERFTYQVRVCSKASSKHLQLARAIIEFTDKAPVEELTDSKGIARFLMDVSYAGQPAKLIIIAEGFSPYTANIDLERGTLPRIVLLESS